MKRSHYKSSFADIVIDFVRIFIVVWDQKGSKVLIRQTCVSTFSKLYLSKKYGVKKALKVNER